VCVCVCVLFLQFDGSAEPATLIEVFWLAVRETMAEGLCVDVRLIVEIHSVRLHNLLFALTGTSLRVICTCRWSGVCVCVCQWGGDNHTSGGEESPEGRFGARE